MSTRGEADDTPLKVTASLDRSIVVQGEGTGPTVLLKVPEPQLWSPASPTLYDLKNRVWGGHYHCDRMGMMVWQDQVSAMADNPEWTRLKPEPRTWKARSTA